MIITGKPQSLQKKAGSPARSQRSASVDDRSGGANPFSVNESDLLGVGNDCDSAQASIASWVDILDHSKLGAIGTGIQTTAVRAELEGTELLSSELGACYEGDQM